MDIRDLASPQGETISRNWPRSVFDARSTLVVPPDAPADAVAKIVDRSRISLVVVAEDDLRVRGVLFPGEVIDRFNARTGGKSRTLGDVVEQLELGRSGKTGPGSYEWLSEIRSGTYWCGGGNHVSLAAYCGDHQCDCILLA